MSDITSVLSSFLEKYNLTPDSLSEKSKEVVQEEDKEWCPYCICKEIVCHKHQILLSKKDLKELIDCIKNDKHHPLLDSNQ